MDTPPIKSASGSEQHSIVLSESSRHLQTTPKQEIAQLRAEERDLACRLEVLRLQAYDHKQRSISSKNSKVLPFWKKIASRQYQTRLDSERENRRLRSLVKMLVGRSKMTFRNDGYKKGNAGIGQLPNEFATQDTPVVMEELKNDADEVYGTLDGFCVGLQQQKHKNPTVSHAKALYAANVDGSN
ncbi:hypothetical protein P3T76_010509 [Phytophthora citrophthora]|uniref:Uncharacterized protein n=1 Tax=Phytophthora citrophthora TaxID=4793 RepID=A0AAD9GCF4_9STRA|nr:hypothetical protein P3T76_010509 [Phytophthora citrophthora]